MTRTVRGNVRVAATSRSSNVGPRCFRLRALTWTYRGRSYAPKVSGYVNHRGWIVLASIASGDHSLCVDLFEHPDGGFGFEHFRSDPEDGRWTAVGGFGGARFPTLGEAARAAKNAVPWLEHDRRASASLEEWLARSQPT